MTEDTLATRDTETSPALPDPCASPFTITVDPVMRGHLRDALDALVENHDDQLALHFASGRLALDSYKEYIEIFARSLSETMASREGVSYLLRSCGFDVKLEDINLTPETRWRDGAGESI